MNTQTTPLGTNAFVAERETFLSIDASEERKQLPEEGKTHGQINFPDSQATQLDAVELEIVRKVTQTAQQTRGALNQHFTEFNIRLVKIAQASEPKAVIDRIGQMANDLKGKLDAMLDKYREDSAITMPEWQREQESYSAFRAKNKLTRAPDYLHLSKTVWWFGVLILVEAALNATLLWELTGILTAFGQTILITMVNVVFGAALTGLFFRYKNVLSLKRGFILLCVPVVLAILTFNVGVGHYRDAIVKVAERAGQAYTDLSWGDDEVGNFSIGDYAQLVMDNIKEGGIKEFLYGIDSALSILLIIIGIGFYGFATYKWYSMLDPHPGYRKSHQALLKKHALHSNLVKNTRAAIEREIHHANAKIADERTKIITLGEQRQDLMDRASTLQDGYVDWIILLKDTQNSLLGLYRSNNRQAREDPAPAYFNNEVMVDEGLCASPKFNPPDITNLDGVVGAVGKTLQKSEGIAENIWQRFNPRADMPPDTQPTNQST